LGKRREIGSAGFSQIFKTDVQPCYGMALTADSPTLSTLPHGSGEGRQDQQDAVQGPALHTIRVLTAADYGAAAVVVDRRPSLGRDRTTPTALICFTNSLHEVALYRRRWRAIPRALFPRKINNLSCPSSWPKLGRRSTAAGEWRSTGIVPSIRSHRRPPL
jgi:hypothetical protein